MIIQCSGITGIIAKLKRFTGRQYSVVDMQVTSQDKMHANHASKCKIYLVSFLNHIAWKCKPKGTVSFFKFTCFLSHYYLAVLHTTKNWVTWLLIMLLLFNLCYFAYVWLSQIRLSSATQLFSTLVIQIQIQVNLLQG